MKTINFLKGVIFYLTVIMSCLTLGIDFDKTPIHNIIMWFIVLGTLVFTTYCYCKYSTKEDLYEFTGANFIKERFGIDLFNED